jgi:hypothetical protein
MTSYSVAPALGECLLCCVPRLPLCSFMLSIACYAGRILFVVVRPPFHLSPFNASEPLAACDLVLQSVKIGEMDSWSWTERRFEQLGINRVKPR